MNELFELENKYLNAKIAYYNGTPFLSDTEFDSLEVLLKTKGSKVIEQVGAKIKDFDFPHPTKMLSLSKIQTELNEDSSVNYMVEPFNKWYDKRSDIVGKQKLLCSPKYDGNAINVIYIGGILSSIITRGDGVKGKNVTDNLKALFPDNLIVDNSIKLKSDDTIEIRCEIVIDKNLFNEKYGEEFANPRNYVAGVIGKDDYDEEKSLELTPIPLNVVYNSEHISLNMLKGNSFVEYGKFEIEVEAKDYADTIKYFEDMREGFKFQLDGAVLTFPEEYRSELGENSHDPEWAIAVKFIPDEAVTTVVGIEWNVGKTGELSPVVLLEPVKLAGTKVQRASGYNYGYIIQNKLGIGSTVSIQKSGDIIPEIKTVIISNDKTINIPIICPRCKKILLISGVHLLCENEICPGKISKQLASNIKLIDIKGIGPKTIDAFAEDFNNLIDLIVWVKTKGNSDEIEKYGIKPNSRSHEIFLNSFNNIKSMSYAQIIVLLGYNNVGLKLAEQVSRYYFDCNPDFTGHEKALVEMLTKPDVSQKVTDKAMELMSIGITIDKPKVKEINENAIYACMTGSPKAFGFATKNEFITKIPNIEEVSLTDKNCKFLITDDYNSTSSKMTTAKKKNIEILTYSDFYEKFK